MAVPSIMKRFISSQTKTVRLDMNLLQSGQTGTVRPGCNFFYFAETGTFRFSHKSEKPFLPTSNFMRSLKEADF